MYITIYLLKLPAPASLASSGVHWQSSRHVSLLRYYLVYIAVIIVISEYSLLYKHYDKMCLMWFTENVIKLGISVK